MNARGSVGDVAQPADAADCPAARSMQLKTNHSRDIATACIVLALSMLVIVPTVHSQGSRRFSRVGFVTPYPIPPTVVEEERAAYKTFEDTLRELGYRDGRNISLLYRTTEGRDELLPTRIAELLALKVDVLLTVGTPATRAAQQPTRTTPIVMVTVLDPVHAGFVANLRHPGGNITGSSELSEELVAKRLELVREAIPKASTVAVLWDPTHPANALDLKQTEEAARTLGLRVVSLPAHDRGEIDRAFGEMQPSHVDALVVLTSYTAFVHIKRIVELATKHWVPTVYGTREGATQGALLSYGPSISDQYRHAADLPVEQPTKFEMAVNLIDCKSARPRNSSIDSSVLSH